MPAQGSCLSFGSRGGGVSCPAPWRRGSAAKPAGPGSIILEHALDVVELELRAERLAEAAAQLLEDAAGTLGVDFARHLHGGVVAVVAPAQRPAQRIGLLLRARRAHAAGLAGAGPLAHLLLKLLGEALSALAHG